MRTVREQQNAVYHKLYAQLKKAGFAPKTSMHWEEDNVLRIGVPWHVVYDIKTNKVDYDLIRQVMAEVDELLTAKGYDVTYQHGYTANDGKTIIHDHLHLFFLIS